MSEQTPFILLFQKSSKQNLNISCDSDDPSRLFFSSPIFPRSPNSEGLTASAESSEWWDQSSFLFKHVFLLPLIRPGHSEEDWDQAVSELHMVDLFHPLILHGKLSLYSYYPPLCNQWTYYSVWATNEIFYWSLSFLQWESVTHLKRTLLLKSPWGLGRMWVTKYWSYMDVFKIKSLTNDEGLNKLVA